MNEVDSMINNAATASPDGEAFSIRIHNKVNDIANSFPVYANNTLGQVLYGYGEKLGLKSNSRCKFYNEQATPPRSTSNLETTIAEFGIGPDDTLGISDEYSNAGA